MPAGATCAAATELPGACQGSSLRGDPHVVTVAVTQNTTYWIRVAGYYSFSEGAYRIRFDLP